MMDKDRTLEVNFIEDPNLIACLTELPRRQESSRNQFMTVIERNIDNKK